MFQGLSGVVPNTWKNIRERNKYLYRYQSLETKVKNNESYHISFSKLNNAVLGVKLGQKHRDTTYLLSDLKEEHSIEDKEHKEEALNAIRNMKRALVIRNIVSIISWLVVFFSVLIVSMLSISAAIGGII